MKRANPILKKILGFCANSYYPKQYLPDKPGFFSSSQHFAGCNLTRDVEVHSTKANLATVQLAASRHRFRQAFAKKLLEILQSKLFCLQVKHR